MNPSRLLFMTSLETAAEAVVVSRPDCLCRLMICICLFVCLCLSRRGSADGCRRAKHHEAASSAWEQEEVTLHHSRASRAAEEMQTAAAKAAAETEWKTHLRASAWSQWGEQCETERAADSKQQSGPGPYSEGVMSLLTHWPLLETPC